MAKKKTTKKKATTEQPASTGRPPQSVTDEQLIEIRTMAGMGATWDTIALKIGLSSASLRSREEVVHAYHVGIADANMTIAGKAFTMAQNIPDMAKFWLKTRAGWREHQGMLDVNITEGVKSSEIISERLDKLHDTLARHVSDKHANGEDS